MRDLEIEQRAAARIGTVLREKYRLDRVLGIGGMAVVYAATHRNQKQFAVKLLHPEISLRADIRTRFLREGYVANSVKHEGAVAVMDDDIAEDGSAFLVMELLEGGAVEELWEANGNVLPLRAVLGLAYQTLDVLAAAHAKGIVHRDIKPANLFLTRSGRLKVLDFGIARLHLPDAGNKATGTGMLLGTPAFMAPEQALAEHNQVDGQTDLWAVGATMFALLSGQMVHEGDNASRMLISAATQRARSLAVVAGHLPERVVAIVDRALAFDKPARWATADQMRDAVRDAYAALFAESIATASLAGLFATDPMGVGSTVAAPTPGPTPAPQATPAGVRLREGGTTSKPVSSRTAGSAPPSKPASRLAVPATVAVVAALAAGIGWQAARHVTPENPPVQRPGGTSRGTVLPEASDLDASPPAVIARPDAAPPPLPTFPPPSSSQHVRPPGTRPPADPYDRRLP